MTNKKEMRAYSISELPKLQKYEVALIGRSNCGKSSLMNRLCHTKTAKVSGTPGHTLWLGIHEMKDVRLIDLPGYGHASTGRVRKEIVTKLVWEYIESSRVDTLFILIDTRRGILPIDEEIISAIDAKCIPMIFVGTKVDKKGITREGLDFYCSSLTGVGIEELRDYIMQLPISTKTNSLIYTK